MKNAQEKERTHRPLPVNTLLTRTAYHINAQSASLFLEKLP